MRAKCKIELTTETDFLHRDRQRTSRYFHLPKVFSRSLIEKLGINEDTDSLRETGNDDFIATIQQKVEETKKLNQTTQNTTRLQSFDKIFNVIISRFTSHQSLLAEIKREYDLVLKSLTNHHNEQEYLKCKIKKLICEVGTPEMLTRELGRVTQMQYELDAVMLVNRRLKRKHEKYDAVFIKYLGELFQKELESIHDENQRMNFKFKGHKVFINDWFLAKSIESDLFRDLMNRYNSGVYDDIDKKIVDEEDDCDPAAKQELKANIASLEHQLERANEKIEAYTDEVDTFTKKIDELVMMRRMICKSSLITPPK
ncbi:hypothetical protein BDR26DRAFT_858944 [Obelidium mucronatum]|nr:hypothetical protein BDR26DRAFT_858944 [Obelidium mucronatum]